VEMVGARHAMAASGNAEGAILDVLVFGNIGYADVGEPAGACVSDGFDEGPVGKDQGIPVLPPDLDVVLTWGEKTKWGSTVTPRTLAFLLRGSARSHRETAGCVYGTVQSNWQRG